MKPKYFITTFGCQMNRSDSERIESVLIEMDFEKALDIKGADLIVVNMCSVRQTAVDRVYGFHPKFKALKKKNPNLKTVLTGCFLRKDQKKLKNIFDFTLPIKTLEFWPELLKNSGYSFYLNTRAKSFTDKVTLDYLKINPEYSHSFSVSIPISNGCNNFCAYCVVPYTRGPLICRSHKDILKEVKNTLKNGAKEIWLLGQNVNDYQSPANKKINFPKLLQMVNNIKGNFWLNFLSSNPKDFSDELINVMASSKKVNRYLSLPVQSGDDKILKKMNRPYTIKKYKKLIREIKKKIPDVALSTDIIVGFPGETKKQFENSVNLFKEVKFDMAYIAQYSPRANTKAFKMKDSVPEKEKIRRREMLTKVLIKTSLKNSEKYVGKEVDVLVLESQKKKNKVFWLGKTAFYKTIKFPALNKKPANLLGKIVKVKVLQILPWGFKAVLA